MEKNEEEEEEDQKAVEEEEETEEESSKWTHLHLGKHSLRKQEFEFNLS